MCLNDAWPFQTATDTQHSSKASNQNGHQNGKQNGKTKGKAGKGGKAKGGDASGGASTVSSGVKLEDVSPAFCPLSGSFVSCAGQSVLASLHDATGRHVRATAVSALVLFAGQNNIQES